MLLITMRILTSCIPAACATAIFIALGTAPQTAPVDENWAQWRGPDGLGIAAGTSYPDEWSADKNVAWKIPVEGRGHSTPVIWGDHLFLTTSIKGEQVA